MGCAHGLLRRRVRAWGCLAALAASTPGGRAWSAPADKQACVDAATRGQIQRDDQKFSAAEEAFASCAQATCPVAVRQKCGEWLADIQAKMPEVTVRFEASSPTKPGALTPTLLVDGKPASFGASMKVDPGAHSLRAEREREPPVLQDFTIAAGEKKTVDMRPPPPPPPPPVTIRRPVPLLVPILGGVALVGIGAGIGFGLAAKSETDRLQGTCAPSCPIEDRDSAYRTALVADIAMGVGIVAAVVSGVLFLTRPTIHERAGSSVGGR